MGAHVNRHQAKSLRFAAAPYLMPGDEIEIVAVGVTGKVAVRPNARKLGVIMILFATAAALGGGMLAYMQPSGRTRVFFVLTDRRLLTFRLGRDSVLLYAASVPRADATMSIAKNGFVRLRVQLDIAPPARGSTATIRIPSMRVTFTKLRPSYRRAGRALLLSLQDAGAAA